MDSHNDRRPKSSMYLVHFTKVTCTDIETRCFAFYYEEWFWCNKKVFSSSIRPTCKLVVDVPGKCSFMQEVEDAQKIRRTVIDCFERASIPTLSDEERKKALQFVIVGGGPTGVEFAAELHDFVNEDIVKLYPQVKDLVKITLLEAGGHILNM